MSVEPSPAFLCALEQFEDHCERGPVGQASSPTFAPLVVERALEELAAPVIKLEIAIGDVVLRTDTAIDGEQLSRVIRAVRASR